MLNVERVVVEMHEYYLSFLAGRFERRAIFSEAFLSVYQKEEQV
jgi:hypothetical protein